MATIQIPVNVLSPNCTTCQCMELDKNTLYAGDEAVSVSYSCRNIHLCQYIRNRIVREEKSKENLDDNAG